MWHRQQAFLKYYLVYPREKSKLVSTLFSAEIYALMHFIYLCVYLFIAIYSLGISHRFYTLHQDRKSGEKNGRSLATVTIHVGSFIVIH